MKYHQTPSFFVNQHQLHHNEGAATTHRLVLGRPTLEAPAPDSVPAQQLRDAHEEGMMEQDLTPVTNRIVVVQIEKETPNPSPSSGGMQDDEEKESGNSLKRVVAPASHSKPPSLSDPRSHPKQPPRQPKRGLEHCYEPGYTW